MLKSLRTRGPLSALLLVVLVLSGLAIAQDEEDRPVTTDQKQAKPIRGRLPAYFSQLVTVEQREEIYSIQARFAEPIAELKKQLKEITDRRDRDVMEVLSAEQQQKLNALKDAARKRREARAAENKGTVKPGDGPAGKPGSR
ncbi:MAG: hypothetical protein VB855_13685 [Pirellulaceae bacterium]